MKKIYIVLAVLGTALISSCVQEKSFSDITVGENEIAFVMQNASTRSAEGSALQSVKGITIPMGKNDLGEALFLEETIEEMNPAPITRGAPAYTAYVGELYPSMGVYAAGNFGDASFAVMDETIYENGGWRYHHNYNGNPWPDKTTPVDFYLRMPAAGTGVVMTGYANKAASFKLTSPLNGASQQDILFGQTTINKEFHDSKLPAGAPVMMYHALTGVKFRNGHPNDNQTKTIITRVEIIGLKGYGEGTANADGTFTWPADKLGTPSTEQAPFFLTFDNPTYVKDNGASNPDGTVSPAAEGEEAGTYNWNSNLGSSWTSAGADHNLNKSDGSLTFWFIPQEISNDVVLKVYFTVKTPDSVNGFASEACHTINLGQMLNEKYQAAGKTGNLKWEAGQLRTYSLKPYDVDVEIEDSISETVKSNLHIANTGNVDEYVRMLIMGNWYGWKPGQDQTTEEPSILVGYKYAGTEEGLTDAQKREMVLPWYREGYDLDNNPDTPNVDPYGYFDDSFLLANLGEARDGKAYDWADASGGFYYTMPIGPGEQVSHLDAATKNLFESYTVTNVPTIYIATEGTHREPAVGVHLVMEIVVQAIAVPKNEDGTDTWWLQAWYDATGIEKLDPNAARNATYKAYYTAGEYSTDATGN